MDVDKYYKAFRNENEEDAAILESIRIKALKDLDYDYYNETFF
jgi:hypothetical protein